MKANAYREMIEKHRKEVNDFPIAFAFNNEQVQSALDKLGATREEVILYSGVGGIMKKTDVPHFEDMMERHREELDNAMNDEEFAEGAFRYEMDNHEYSISWDGDEVVLDCFGFGYEDLKNRNLVDAYSRARKSHYENVIL